jgi:hypothetical protein
MAWQYQYLKMEEFFKETITMVIFAGWDMNYLQTEIFMLDTLRMESSVDKAHFIGLIIMKCIRVNGKEDYRTAKECISAKMFIKELFLMD